MVLRPLRDHSLLYTWPFLCTLIYVSLFASQSQGLDGFDVWPTISEGKESPRQEILHNIDPLHKPPVQTMTWDAGTEEASGSHQNKKKTSKVVALKSRFAEKLLQVTVVTQGRVRVRFVFCFFLHFCVTEKYNTVLKQESLTFEKVVQIKISTKSHGFYQWEQFAQLSCTLVIVTSARWPRHVSVFAC